MVAAPAKLIINNCERSQSVHLLRRFKGDVGEEKKMSHLIIVRRNFKQRKQLFATFMRRDIYYNIQK
jgi:hypothetical protein